MEYEQCQVNFKVLIDSVLGRHATFW